jgi:hypothetical protein
MADQLPLWPHSPHKLQRDREIRDIYNRLMPRYRYHIILTFIERNYWVREGSVMQILRRVDAEPVDPERASIAYNTAMGPDFHL